MPTCHSQKAMFWSLSYSGGGGRREREGCLPNTCLSGKEEEGGGERGGHSVLLHCLLFSFSSRLLLPLRLLSHSLCTAFSPPVSPTCSCASQPILPAATSMGRRRRACLVYHLPPGATLPACLPPSPAAWRAMLLLPTPTPLGGGGGGEGGGGGGGRDPAWVLPGTLPCLSPAWIQHMDALAAYPVPHNIYNLLPYIGRKNTSHLSPVCLHVSLPCLLPMPAICLFSGGPSCLAASPESAWS